MLPYKNVDVRQWKNVTLSLVEKHPLKNHLVDICLKSWESILNGKINTYLNLQIKEMSISPQATGALLHDVIPEYIAKNFPDFRKGIGKEKDIVCISNDDFSLELKTSSQKSIFGNRSYALSDTGKSKNGYYLTINFEKISSPNPRILLIQLGWLEHSDWKGQSSKTGQKASLTKEARENKLIVLYKQHTICNKKITSPKYAELQCQDVMLLFRKLILSDDLIFVNLIFMKGRHYEWT